MWVFYTVVIITVVLVMLFPEETLGFAEPHWSQEVCTVCRKKTMQWKPGKDAGSTGEAFFECNECGHGEHRGGMASEIAMENRNR